MAGGGNPLTFMGQNMVAMGGDALIQKAADTEELIKRGVAGDVGATTELALDQMFYGPGRGSIKFGKGRPKYKTKKRPKPKPDTKTGLIPKPKGYKLTGKDYAQGRLEGTRSTMQGAKEPSPKYGKRLVVQDPETGRFKIRKKGDLSLLQVRQLEKDAAKAIKEAKKGKKPK
jgi:hypothetical protein